MAAAAAATSRPPPDQVLDLAPYTRDSHATADGEARGGGGGGGGGAADGGGASGGGVGDTRYRLTAVLMHSGPSAHSGHYTARIMEQPGGDEPADGDAGGVSSAGGGGRWRRCGTVTGRLGASAVQTGPLWEQSNNQNRKKNQTIKYHL